MCAWCVHVHGVCAWCVHGVSALCVHGVCAVCVHGVSALFVHGVCLVCVSGVFMVCAWCVHVHGVCVPGVCALCVFSCYLITPGCRCGLRLPNFRTMYVHVCVIVPLISNQIRLCIKFNSYSRDK